MCVLRSEFMAAVLTHMNDNPGDIHTDEQDDICHVCIKELKSTFVNTGMDS